MYLIRLKPERLVTLLLDLCLEGYNKQKITTNRDERQIINRLLS